MNFKYTVIRASSAFTAGNETIMIILELQGQLTVKSQAASSPLFTHAGQMAAGTAFRRTLFPKHIHHNSFNSSRRENAFKLH